MKYVLKRARWLDRCRPCGAGLFLGADLGLSHGRQSMVPVGACAPKPRRGDRMSLIRVDSNSPVTSLKPFVAHGEFNEYLFEIDVPCRVQHEVP